MINEKEKHLDASAFWEWKLKFDGACVFKQFWMLMVASISCWWKRMGEEEDFGKRNGMV